VADQISIGKTITSVEAAMLCYLVNAHVVMRLPLSILWGNTLEVWVILALNDILSIVGKEWEWNPLQRMNSVLRRVLDIQTIPQHGHPPLISRYEQILVVTMCRVEGTVKTVKDQLTHGAVFKHINVLQTENANLTRTNLNTSINKAAN
jgi:hypothetical protein